MKRVAAILAAVLIGMAPNPANAQQKLEVSAGSKLEHRHSGLGVPAALMGIERSNAVANEDDHLDIAADYSKPDQSDIYTIYIYRHVAGGLPVWFDRARWMIENRDVYGPSPKGRDEAFVPPGQANASALIASYELEGSIFRSTGVALVPLGEWIVKLRASSKTRTAAELEADMKQALAALDWPATIAAAPAAAAVRPCTTELALSGDARVAPAGDDDLAAAMLGALVSSVAANREPKRTAGPEPVWCRDRAEVSGGGVYRSNEQTDGYLLALADAGRGVSVGPNPASALMAQAGSGKAGAERWSVALVLLSRTLTAEGFDRLPPPAQAMAIASEGPFSSTVPTWGAEKGKIEINSDVVR